MSRASPGNSLPINSWKCAFDSILSTSNLKGGKKLFACFPHPLPLWCPKQGGERRADWEVGAAAHRSDFAALCPNQPPLFGAWGLTSFCWGLSFHLKQGARASEAGRGSL